MGCWLCLLLHLRRSRARFVECRSLSSSSAVVTHVCVAVVVGSVSLALATAVSSISSESLLSSHRSTLSRGSVAHRRVRFETDTSSRDNDAPSASGRGDSRFRAGAVDELEDSADDGRDPSRMFNKLMTDRWSSTVVQPVVEVGVADFTTSVLVGVKV